MPAELMNGLDHLWFKLRKSKRIAKRSGQVSYACPPCGPRHALIAVTGGCGSLLTPEQSFAVEEGAVYVAEPGALLSMVPEGETPLTFYWFEFDVKSDRGREQTGDGRPGLQPMRQLGKPLRIPPVSLSAMSAAAYGSMAGDSGLERFRGQFMFQELLHRVWSELTAEPSDELHIALEHLRAYIEQHYYEPLSIKRLAGLSKISPRHLVQMFRDKYQVEPMDYVRSLRSQRRMAKAELAGRI